MVTEKKEWGCVCDDPRCDKSCGLTYEESLYLFAEAPYDHMYIVDGCPHGIEPDWVLVEQREGYAIYQGESEGARAIRAQWGD